MIERQEKPEPPSIAEYPDVNGGYPVIGSTRIAVRLVVEALRETQDVDATVAAFPELRREQVLAALDFYRDDPARVDEDIDRNARALRAIRSR